MGVTYRKAAAFDAERIADMMRRFVDCPWTAEQVKAEIENPNALFYVATAGGGEVVGFLSGVCAADECEISDVAVEQLFRRQGVATGLFKLLFSDIAARGAKNVFLLVRSDNLPAIALYEKLGFCAVGKRSGYYGGADAAIMRLEL